MPYTEGSCFTSRPKQRRVHDGYVFSRGLGHCRASWLWPTRRGAACTGRQSIKTDAAGVYGYSFPASVTGEGGFSVAILGAGTAPLFPGDWQEADRPSFLFEIVDPL